MGKRRVPKILKDRFFAKSLNIELWPANTNTFSTNRITWASATSTFRITLKTIANEATIYIRSLEVYLLKNTYPRLQRHVFRGGKPADLEFFMSYQ